MYYLGHFRHISCKAATKWKEREDLRLKQNTCHLAYIGFLLYILFYLPLITIRRERKAKEKAEREAKKASKEGKGAAIKA